MTKPILPRAYTEVWEAPRKRRNHPFLLAFIGSGFLWAVILAIFVILIVGANTR